LRHSIEVCFQRRTRYTRHPVCVFADGAVGHSPEGPQLLFGGQSGKGTEAPTDPMPITPAGSTHAGYRAFDRGFFPSGSLSGRGPHTNKQRIDPLFRDSFANRSPGEDRAAPVTAGLGRAKPPSYLAALSTPHLTVPKRETKSNSRWAIDLVRRVRPIWGCDHDHNFCRPI
jgi:hypothetical protein